MVNSVEETFKSLRGDVFEENRYHPFSLERPAESHKLREAEADISGGEKFGEKTADPKLQELPPLAYPCR